MENQSDQKLKSLKLQLNSDAAVEAATEIAELAKNGKNLILKQRGMERFDWKFGVTCYDSHIDRSIRFYANLSAIKVYW